MTPTDGVLPALLLMLLAVFTAGVALEYDGERRAARRRPETE